MAGKRSPRHAKPVNPLEHPRFKVENVTQERKKITTSGEPIELQAGTSLHREGETIHTHVKNSNNVHSRILEGLPQDATVRRLFARSHTNITPMSKGNKLQQGTSANTGRKEPIKTGRAGPSVKNTARAFEQGTVANKQKHAYETRRVSELSTPTKSNLSLSISAQINATIRETMAAIGTASRVQPNNSINMQTKIAKAQAQIHSTSTSEMVAQRTTSSILPVRPQPSANAIEIAANAKRLIPVLNHAVGNISSRKTKKSELTIVRTRKNRKRPHLALHGVNTESSSTNSLVNSKYITALAPPPAPPPLSQKKMSTRAGRKKAAREQRRQEPFENLNTIFRLAQKQGFGPQIAPNSFGIAKTVRRKRVGKKTIKKIIYNSEQKQILERKLDLAEKKAMRGTSFLNKVLGGLGFYPKEGENAKQYIESLQSKIRKLDSNIEKGEYRVDQKRAKAQNNATIKNSKAKQKAINRTKYYRDLLTQYYTAETTGKIEVNNTHRNTNEANAIKKERAEKKTKPKNILPTNANLSKNMQELFKNTAATKKNSGTGTANTITPALKTETPTQPLVPRINITAKNTKRKATANAMAGKDPYALLGLDPKTIKAEDLNLTVKDTFDKLLRTKKPKNITDEEHDTKLAKLRQARDFLLNNTLRTGFNSRVVQTINPATAHRSNAAQLLADQRKEPNAIKLSSGASTPIGYGQSFGQQI